MPTRAKLQATAPILLTKNVHDAVDYYIEKVGFELVGIYGEPEDFAIVKRDGNVLMLAQIDDPEQIVPNWKIREKMWDVYFWVDDIDALYQEMQEREAIIDYTLYEAPHGAREFGIQDLDDHDIAFGEFVE